MPRKARELSPIEVSRLVKPGHHAVGGVAGLTLYVNTAAGRSWVLRMTIGSKRRHMGLGGFPDVTLAQVRAKARAIREQASQGIDPIQERTAAMNLLRASQESEKTFSQATTGYLETHGDSWKSAKHRAQWRSSLETYAFPVLSKLLVRDVALEHVLAVLEPIWRSKNETASRVRGRIESVLDWSAARGMRAVDNPARWKGLLDKLLPAPGKVQSVQHHRALPIDEVPDFMDRLRGRNGNAALALEFAILTAALSGEVRGATWSEMDVEAQIWTIPASRMKAGREHRVPLSLQALEILDLLPKGELSELVFPAPKGGAFSDMAFTALTRRMEIDAVPHGFRSSFRDWVGERTNYPGEIAEQALAHVLESKVEAAYRRGDALERRRLMMQEWGDFCSSAE